MFKLFDTMSLNDPFGRIQQKQRHNYETLRSSLRSKGVNSRDAAEVVLKNVLKNALLMITMVVLVVLASALFFPDSIAIVIVFAVIALFWIATTALNGYRLVKRYIEQELPR